jgi:uroporphyrinogen III methyltransferase/synthase
MQQKPAKIYFIGAGPGDPRWLTSYAKELLQTAEVVAHDDLIDPRLLDLVGWETELLPIGYRGFRQRRAAVLHPLVVDRLQQGHNVVRLKSGDPMIYGRTLEEIAEAKELGVDWEVVPGITAAFGAAAATGIPLTHRGLSSGVRMVAGNHVCAEHAKQETLVVYMPRRKIQQLCDELQRQGRPGEQPAAFIQGASTKMQRTTIGTLATLPGLVAETSTDIPGVVLIGDVVAMESLPAADQRPLTGKRIAIARSSLRRSPLHEPLTSRGADVVEVPRLRAKALWPLSDIVGWFKDLKALDRVIFTSPYAVQLMLLALQKNQVDLRTLAAFSAIGVDHPTCEALNQAGLFSARHLAEFTQDCSQDLASAKLKGPWYCFGQQAQGRRLARTLAAQTAPRRLEVAAVYDLMPQSCRLNAPPPDLVVVPNRRAANWLLTKNPDTDWAQLTFMTLGPQTSEYLYQMGAQRIITAPQADYASLLQIIDQWADGSCTELMMNANLPRGDAL